MVSNLLASLNTALVPGASSLGALLPPVLAQTSDFPDGIKIVVAWGKTIVGGALGYKVYDEMGGQGGMGDKMKAAAPYALGLLLIVTPKWIMGLLGADSSPLLDLFSSWKLIP